MSIYEAVVRERDAGMLNVMWVDGAPLPIEHDPAPPVKPAGYQLMSQPGDDTRVYHTYRAEGQTHELGVHTDGTHLSVDLDPATAVRLAQAILAAEDWAAHDIASKHQ